MVAEIQAAFPIRHLAPIKCRLNLTELLQLLKAICRCSRVIDFCLDPLGYQFVSLTTMNYARFTAIALNITPPTLDAPTYNGATTVGERDITKLQWLAQKMENDNICNMNEALTTIFLSAIPMKFKSHIETDFVEQLSQFFLNIFNCYITKYYKYNPVDLDNNKNKTNHTWDTN